MGILIIADNRKARFDFEIIEKFEAGMVLRGSEVKSLRNRQCQLKDSYVVFKSNEAFLVNAHISVYKESSYNNHIPERERKLLLNRSELRRIESQIAERGLTCVALKVYFKDGTAKIEIALAKGKKKFDKRNDIKKHDANREIQRSLRR